MLVAHYLYWTSGILGFVLKQRKSSESGDDLSRKGTVDHMEDVGRMLHQKHHITSKI